MARKSEQKAMVFIDEYKAPNHRAYELGFFAKVASFVSFPITIKVEDSDLG